MARIVLALAALSAVLGLSGPGPRPLRATRLHAQARTRAQPPGQPLVRRYNQKLYGLAQQRRHKEARAVLEEMRLRGVAPSVVSHNHLLQALSRAGRFDELAAHLEAMGRPNFEVRPNAFTYGIAVSAAAKEGQATAAAEMVQEMMRAGVAPNVVVLGALVNAYEKVGDWESALLCLERMVKLGVSPNIITYNSALSATAKLGEAPVALGLLRFLQDKACGPPTDCDSPSLATMKRVVQGLTEASHVHAIPEPDSITYSTVLIALQRAKAYPEIVQVFQEMLHSSNPDVRPESRSLSCYLYACSQLGDGPRAAQTLRRMREAFGVRPDNFMFSMAISACGKSRDWRGALRLVQEDLPREGLELDEFVLSTAITACALPTEEAWKAGLRLYESYMKAGGEPGEVLTGAAMKAAAAGGLPAAALAILRRWESRGNRATTRMYNTGLAAALRSSPPDVESTRFLLQEMEAAEASYFDEEELDSPVENHGKLVLPPAATPDLISYGTAIAVEARLGREEHVQRALDLLDVMRRKGLRPSERIYAMVLNAVSDLRGASGENNPWKDSLGVLRKALADDVVPTTLLVNPVFATLAALPMPTANELRQAIHLLRALENAGRQVSNAAIADLISALIAVGGADNVKAARKDLALPLRERLGIAVKLLRLLRERSGAPNEDTFGPAQGFPVAVATELVTVAERLGAYPEALRGLEEMRLAGVSFYEVGVFDGIFRRLVQGWSSTVGRSMDNFGPDELLAMDYSMGDEDKEALLQRMVAQLDSELMGNDRRRS